MVFRDVEGWDRHGGRIAGLSFFGGEPTLRIDLIERICELVVTELSPQVRLLTVTNGTLDARRHIPVWRRYRFRVSVSLDGPAAIHDRRIGSP